LSSLIRGTEHNNQNNYNQGTDSISAEGGYGGVADQNNEDNCIQQLTKIKRGQPMFNHSRTKDSEVENERKFLQTASLEGYGMIPNNLKNH
jgi:hypothetical protein